MDNKLNPYNVNALSLLMGPPEDESIAQMIARQQYYKSILGDSSQQRMNPQMLTLVDRQISDDPRIRATFMSPQARFVEGMGYQTPPPSLMGRLGLESDALGGQVRAGAQTMAVQFPDGTVRIMPRTFDVGYRTPFMGGSLDVGGSVTPKEGLMPETMYNLQARYRKTF